MRGELVSSLRGRLSRLRGRTRREAAAPRGAEGGRVYAAWLWLLPVLMGLTLGWFADACLEALLGRFGTERAVGRSALPAEAERASSVGAGMEEFLTANPFRVSPMEVSLPTARSADVEVTGSLATAVLRGTLPDVGAWIEDKGKVRLVLMGTSFDVYTLAKVTYREAVFVKEDEVVVRELRYSEPGSERGAFSTPVAEARPVGVPEGSVTPARPGEQDGEVPSELVTSLVQNPFDELKKIRLRPNDGGNGLEIQWIQDDSILKQLGVQKGDVIKSVNGIPFTNMADIANSINSLMNSERFDVEVDREGKPTALRYVVH